MLCHVCRQCLEGIGDPSKTKRVGYFDENDQRVAVSDQDELAQAVAALQDNDTPEHERYIFAHHKTKESLLRSKFDDCAFCYQIGKYEGPIGAGDVEQFGYFTTFRFGLLKRGTGMRFGSDFLSMQIFCNHHAVPAVATGLTPYLEGESHFINDSITDSTEDMATWYLIKHWLGQCLQGHSTCNLSERYTPTRLLKLESRGQSRTFRLVSRNQVGPGAKYAALSHSWGTKPWDERLILNKDNFDSLSKPQDIEILPRTFRDAFAVLDRLHLRYLWIDRFCIFQDSEDDWREEASSMHKVYASSFICISALGAADDDAGLFFSRDPEKVKVTVVNIPINGSDEPVPHICGNDLTISWRREFEKEVLTARGWVMQERVLSPRVLHFGRRQVFWECHSNYHIETLPKVDRWADSRSGPELERTGHQLAWKTLIGWYPNTCENRVDSLYLEWGYLAYKYSKCHLTKGEDKLVAISAIAKDMKKHLTRLGEPSDYLAGLWRERLPEALLWRIEKHRSRKRPDSYQAPSWSWASVNEQVIQGRFIWLPSSSRDLVAAVVSATTTPVTTDDTGQVLDGKLILKCPLIKCTVGDQVSPVAYIFPFDRMETVEGDPLECRSDSDEIHQGFNVDFDSPEEELPGTFIFAPITLDSTKQCSLGLALAKSGDCYRRVGYADAKLSRRALRSCLAVPPREIVIV